jgi:transcriptional regulator with GAF, ATPase, and Fis domain
MNPVEMKTEQGSGVDVRGREMGAMAQWSLRVFRDEAEMNAISSALHKTGWNRKRAARLLSISYRGLLYKIRRHNIAPPVELS